MLPIGVGGKSRVYRLQIPTRDTTCAAKIADAGRIEKIEKEFQLLKSLEHKNVVKCLGDVRYKLLSVDEDEDEDEDEMNEIYGILLEEYPMTLSEALDKYNYSLANIVYWFEQLWIVVKWLQEKEIIHGDINLFNILTEADVRNIRLCDFEGQKDWKIYMSLETEVRFDFEQIGATFSEILKNYLHCETKNELITEKELEPLSPGLGKENFKLLCKMVYDTASVSADEIDEFMQALGPNEEVPLKPVRSEETNIDEKKAKVIDVIFGIKYLIVVICVMFFACIIGYYYTGG